MIGGTLVPNTLTEVRTPVNSIGPTVHLMWMQTMTAGEHTFKVQWSVGGVSAQNPLTPELISEVRQLDELRFVMLLLAFALVVMLLMVINDWRQTSQYGRQVEASAKNSDRLAVNTDALQEQTAVLKQMASDNTRKLALIEQGNHEAKAARTAAETAVAAIDDSGLRKLPDLVKEHMSAQAPVLERATAALEHVASALKDLRESGSARDDKLEGVLTEVLGELSSVRGVLERVALPVAVVVPSPAGEEQTAEGEPRAQELPDPPTEGDAPQEKDPDDG